MQNQTSLWLEIRRDRLDWIYLQRWGAMNPTALKEASKIDFPMNRLVGVWWAGGEDDVRPAGELAKGYSTLNFSGVGQNSPAIQDILKYVVDKDKSQITSRRNLLTGCRYSELARLICVDYNPDSRAALAFKAGPKKSARPGHGSVPPGLRESNLRPHDGAYSEWTRKGQPGPGRDLSTCDQ
jgi:Periplasmic binding protein